jgi:hypothetical protein
MRKMPVPQLAEDLAGVASVSFCDFNQQTFLERSVRDM